MTKARARERAKARAAAKAGRPVAKGEKPEAKPKTGKFDPKINTEPNMTSSANIKNMARTSRGAARSR